MYLEPLYSFFPLQTDVFNANLTLLSISSSNTSLIPCMCVSLSFISFLLFLCLFSRIKDIIGLSDDLFPTYKTRDPKAREWVETLPLAVGGGGVSIPFYQNLIKDDLNDWIKKHCGDHQGNKRCQGFRRVDINSNQKDFITDFSNIDCSRIAVAMGLSYPINNFDDIKKYYKECEIDDIPVNILKKDISQDYISKDQI